MALAIFHHKKGEEGKKTDMIFQKDLWFHK
jgi:hypothetical protein